MRLSSRLSLVSVVVGLVEFISVFVECVTIGIVRCSGN